MINRYQEIVAVEYQTGKLNGDSIDVIMYRITSKIPIHVLPVEDKVVIA